MSSYWEQRFAEAERRKREQNAQESVPVRRRRPTSLPSLSQALFVRLGGVDQQTNAVRTCPLCQETILPKRYSNGYVPQKCACERDEARRKADQQARLDTWKAQESARRKQCARCYTWLDPSMPVCEHQTFASYRSLAQPDGFLAGYELTQHLISGRPAHNLILWSASPGTGKTHIARAICNALLEQTIPCLFASGQNLFHAFGQRFEAGHGVEDYIDQAGRTPLLVLDDLDKVYTSDFKRSALHSILDQRYTRHVPTVITMNTEVTEVDMTPLWEYIGAYACSRLKGQGLQIVQMEGLDYREKGM